VQDTAMVAVASAAVVFNVVLGLCLHGACCTGLPHGHSHGHGHSAHTRLIEEPDSDHVHVHPKASPGQVDQLSVLFLFYVTISVSDPDPYWIRIQSGQWIRTRILILNPG
jgi:hypothetical protein